MAVAPVSTSSRCRVSESWWRNIADALKPWRMKLKITWYPSSLRLMCNDPVWLTLKKKHFLWTDTFTLNILALIRPTASNIAYLLLSLSLDLISPHLWGKNKLKCWQRLFFFLCRCVLMADIRGPLAFSWDDKHTHSMSKPLVPY